MRLFGVLLLTCAAAAGQDGAALFEKQCAMCHRAGSDTRAPLREALAKMPRPAVIAALETGSMKSQGTLLTAAERKAIAEFLSKVETTPQTAPTGLCPAGAPKPSDAPGWNGWGVDLDNSRFQPAAVAGLAAGQVPSLKLKWAFGFPHATTAFGQPTIADGRIFAGSEDGTVYALDASTGCVYWTYKAAATVRTAIWADLAASAIYFGDVRAQVYRLNAASGELVWKVKVEEHPFAR